MKNKLLLRTIALSLTGLALFGCGANPAEGDGNADNEGNKEPDSGQTEVKKLESITVKEEYKSQNLKHGDIFYVDGDTYTCLPKGLPSKERKVKITITKGADSVIKDEDGMFRCVGVGEGEITITSALYPDIKDTLKVSVTESFFSRDTGNPNAFDLTEEMPTEQKGGKVISNGQTGDLYFKDGHSTKWFAETEITLNAVSEGEKFPKFGLVSYNTKRDTDNIYSRIYFFLNAEIGDEGVKDFDKIGVCEVRNAEGYAWNPGINNATARHKDDLFTISPKITYGTKFKIGFARDGIRYYTWVNDQYTGCFDTLPDLIPADVPSAVGLFQFNSNVTFENYSSTTDSAKIDEKIGSIGEDLKMITEWTKDDAN